MRACDATENSRGKGANDSYGPGGNSRVKVALFARTAPIIPELVFGL